ncbi:metal-dependent hydrolase, partial [Rothia dentocariosa]
CYIVWYTAALLGFCPYPLHNFIIS